MSVTITLSNELENRLREDAARQGVPVEELVSREVQNLWPAKPLSETGLLEKINDGFPESFWLRYHSLKEKLDRDTILESEYQEYMSMVDQVERKHTARLGYIAELAKLRGSGFLETIRALGLEPTP